MNRQLTILRCEADSPRFSAAYLNVRGIAETEVHTADPHLIACFVAMCEDTAVGRVAVYSNPEVTHKNATTMLLGRFECIHDTDVCKALLDAASGLGHGQGAAWMLGPMNGSTWNSYRFVTKDSTLEPFVTEVRHPEYYADLWLKSEFTAVSDYISSLAPIHAVPVDETIVSANNLRVRIIDAANLREELRRVYPLVRRAFSKNRYYSRISELEFIEKLIPLQALLDNAFTRIVDDANGDAVAFVLCIPDVLNPTARRLVIKTIAKSDDCAIPGLMTTLVGQIVNDAAAAGFREAIHAYMQVDNRSVKRSKDFAGVPVRHYALFAKPC